MSEHIAEFLKRVGNPSVCKFCKDAIFWVTDKRGRPYAVNNDLKEHLRSCPHIREVKKKAQMRKDKV